MGTYVGFTFAVGSQGLIGEKAISSDLELISYTDVSADLQFFVHTNSNPIVNVQVEYWKAPNYPPTIISLPDVTEDDYVTLTIEDLLPDTSYEWLVRLTTSNGIDISSEQKFDTAIPTELSDGNWYAQFDFDADTNVVDGSNRVSQFRDNFQNNTEGAELIPNGDMSSTTGWTLNGQATIAGGVMNMTAASYGSVWRGDSSANRYKVYNTRFDITSIASGNHRVAHANPPVDFNTSGSKAVLGHISDGTYLMRLQGYPAATCVIDNASQKRVLGNHLIQWTDANKPTKETSYITFDGTTDWLRNAVEAGLTFGTVYALVQRIGTDDDFVMRNDLTGLGEYAGNYLRLGSNQAGTTWYNFRIKKLYIRSVVDGAGTIEKLNEYLSREDVVGVLATGVWNDNAVWDDNQIPVTI